MCCVCVLSCVQLFATPWTVARQTLLSMGFPRQEYWSGLPFPSPEDLPDPWIKPASPASAYNGSLPLNHLGSLKGGGGMQISSVQSVTHCRLTGCPGFLGSAIRAASVIK